MHNLFSENLTSGQIEGYFQRNRKRNIDLKQPISYFVKKSYQSLLWEQSRYFDGAVHGSQKLNGGFNEANSQEKNQKETRKRKP